MATPLPLAGDAVSFPIHLGIGAILQNQVASSQEVIWEQC